MIGRRGMLVAGLSAAGLVMCACSKKAEPRTSPASVASPSSSSPPSPTRTGNMPFKVGLDIPYAAKVGAAHLLDLYVPASGAGPFPVVLLVNGSAFRSDNTKGGSLALPHQLAGGEVRVTGVGGGGASAKILATRWAPHGIAVAAVNVSTSAEGHFPQQVFDLKAAVRYLRAHAQEYQLDAGRFATMGTSSGSWVATMTAVTGGVADLEGGLGNAAKSSAVQACVDLFGPTDFLQLGPTHDPASSPESQLMGFPIQSRPGATERANPCRYVGPESPPMFISHGLADPLVPPEQSELLFAAYQKAKAPATLCLVPKAGHGDGYLASAALSTGRTVKITSGGRTTVGSSPAPTYDALLAFLQAALD